MFNTVTGPLPGPYMSSPEGLSYLTGPYQQKIYCAYQ